MRNVTEMVVYPVDPVFKIGLGSSESHAVPSIYSSARTELAKLLIYGLFRFSCWRCSWCLCWSSPKDPSFGTGRGLRYDRGLVSALAIDGDGKAKLPEHSRSVSRPFEADEFSDVFP